MASSSLTYVPILPVKISGHIKWLSQDCYRRPATVCLSLLLNLSNTQNGNNVLQVLISLQNPLHLVLLA